MDRILAILCAGTNILGGREAFPTTVLSHDNLSNKNTRRHVKEDQRRP
jgi:hypothetical protein